MKDDICKKQLLFHVSVMQLKPLLKPQLNSYLLQAIHLDPVFGARLDEAVKFALFTSRGILKCHEYTFESSENI